MGHDMAVVDSPNHQYIVYAENTTYQNDDNHHQILIMYNHFFEGSVNSSNIYKIWYNKTYKLGCPRTQTTTRMISYSYMLVPDKLNGRKDGVSQSLVLLWTHTFIQLAHLSTCD